MEFQESYESFSGSFQQNQQPYCGIYAGFLFLQGIFCRGSNFQNPRKKAAAFKVSFTKRAYCFLDGAHPW